MLGKEIRIGYNIKGLIVETITHLGGDAIMLAGKTHLGKRRTMIVQGNSRYSVHGGRAIKAQYVKVGDTIKIYNGNTVIVNKITESACGKFFQLNDKHFLKFTSTVIKL